MHRPAFDSAWFALAADVRIWLSAVWLLGLWCMDHEGHVFSRMAWDIQQEIWSEETDRHVRTAPVHKEAGALEAPEPPPPCSDMDEETTANMISHGWPGAGPYRSHPPRVALYRVGPRREDVCFAYGDYVTWWWSP